MPTIAELRAGLAEPKLFASTDPDNEYVKIQYGKITYITKSGKEIAARPLTYLPVSAEDMPAALKWESYGYHACEYFLSTIIRKWIIVSTTSCFLIEQSTSFPEVFWVIILGKYSGQGQHAYIIHACKVDNNIKEDTDLRILFDAIALCHDMYENRNCFDSDRDYLASDPVDDFENIFRGEFSANVGVRQFVASWLAGAPGAFIVNNPQCKSRSVNHGDIIIKTLEPPAVLSPEHVKLWQWIAVEFGKQRDVCNRLAAEAEQNLRNVQAQQKRERIMTITHALLEKKLAGSALLEPIRKHIADHAMLNTINTAITNGSISAEQLQQELESSAPIIPAIPSEPIKLPAKYTAEEYKWLLMEACRMFRSQWDNNALIRHYRPCEIEIIKKTIGLDDKFWYSLKDFCKELYQDEVKNHLGFWDYKKLNSKIDEIILTQLG